MEDERKQYMWDVNHDVGQSIKELRILRGLTIEQGAALAGITEKRLAAIERGNLPHGVYHIARIVESFGGRLSIVTEESKEGPHCQFIEFVDD